MTLRLRLVFVPKIPVRYSMTLQIIARVRQCGFLASAYGDPMSSARPPH